MNQILKFKGGVHPKIILKLAANTKPISIFDETTGNRLVLLPSPIQESGFQTPSQFLDFKILQTVQGIAIEQHAADLLIRVDQKNLLIEKPAGLLLASLKDRANKRKKGVPVSLLNFSTPDTKNLSRLQVARQTLAMGLYIKAHTQLKLLKQEAPQVQQNPFYLSLLGITNFLNSQPHRALQILNAAALKGDPEINFWKALIGFQLNKTSNAFYPDIQKNASYLKSYPMLIKHRGLLITIDAALRAKKSPTEFLRQFNIKAANPFDRARYYLLIARWYIQQGKQEKALEIFERIKGLRSLSKNNENEFLVLEELVAFYKEANDPRKMLNVMIQAQKNCPLHPRLAQLVTNNKNIFVASLIDESLFTPLQRVSFYHDCKDFIGEQAYNINILKKVTQSLINLDLLTQASEYLQRAMPHLPAPYKKALTPVLGHIYLLNAQPKRALKTLNSVDMHTLSDTRSNRIKYLMVQAHRQLNQLQAAESLLQDDSSDRARMLKLKLAGDAKDWQKAIFLLESILATQQDPMFILQYAITLATGDQVNKLKIARNKYLEIMDKTEQKEAFRLLTHVDDKIPLTYTDYQQKLIAADDFLEVLKAPSRE